MTEQDLISFFHVGISLHNFNKKAEREFGISLVQWRLLKQLIDMPAVSAFNLAKAVGVHPSTLTQTLRRLEIKKYIFIAEDPKDSRKKVISLTRQGKNILDRVEIQIGEWKVNLLPVREDLLRVRTLLDEKS